MMVHMLLPKRVGSSLRCGKGVVSAHPGSGQYLRPARAAGDVHRTGIGLPPSGVESPGFFEPGLDSAVTVTPPADLDTT